VFQRRLYQKDLSVVYTKQSGSLSHTQTVTFFLPNPRLPGWSTHRPRYFEICLAPVSISSKRTYSLWLCTNSRSLLMIAITSYREIQTLCQHRLANWPCFALLRHEQIYADICAYISVFVFSVLLVDIYIKCHTWWKNCQYSC
jgi:hypothetical protein